ncbi:MAG: hypothetical protein ABI723_05130 [Bacteroidia bacterium]
MSATELKSGINKLMKKTNDEKLLRIVFNLMNDFENENKSKSVLSDEQWKEINERIKRYDAGKSKGYSFAQLKQQVKVARGK